ncbi:cubilin-like isoform X2 [Watersipora subatra]|uniref:cubilin-like isoform X2 n=1 Tax=Watersipora subatra TaxID=2589382 RepID=UPI00355B15B7
MPGLHWLAIIMELAFLHISEGNEYHCVSTPQTAYTPVGIFSLPPGGLDSPSSCKLAIARDLFRSSKAKLKITIQYFNRTNDSGCSGANLLVANINRYCSSIMNRTIEINETSTSSAPLEVSYQRGISNNPSFLIRYVIYNEVCEQTEPISATPVVIHQSHGPSYADSRCFLSILTSEAHLLLVSTLSIDSESGICSSTDAVYLETELGLKLCQGVECLISDGINITGLPMIRVELQQGYNCGFFWMFTTQSRITAMDICSQTGNELSLPEGSISSPGYLSGFSGPLNCTITISPRFDIVAVDLKYYNLKQRPCQDSLNNNPCYCGDRLVINKTASCGNMVGARRKFYQMERPLTIELLTLADLGTNNGFYLSYQGYENAVDICADRQKLSLPLLVKSPSFPGNYPGVGSCQMNVDVAGVDRLLIEFLVFNIERDDTCSIDYLSINGRRFCGNRGGDSKKLDLSSSAVSLQLNFKSDTSGDHQGFYISIDKYVTASTTSTTSSTTIPMSMAATITSSTEASKVSISSAYSAAAMKQGTEITATYSEITTEDGESVNNHMRYSQNGKNTKSIRQENVTQSPNNESEAASQECNVPWYYWIITIIGILSAVLITMTIFLIKLKRKQNFSSRCWASS